MAYTKIYIDFIKNLKEGIYTPVNQSETSLLKMLQEPINYEDDNQPYILGQRLHYWLYDYVDVYSITALQHELLTYATDTIDFYNVVNSIMNLENLNTNDISTTTQGFSTGETFHTSLVITNKEHYSNLNGEYVFDYVNDINEFKRTVNLDIKAVSDNANYSDYLIPRFISQIIKNIHYNELI